MSAAEFRYAMKEISRLRTVCVAQAAEIERLRALETAIRALLGTSATVQPEREP